MGKITDFIQKFDIEFNWKQRLLLGGLVLILLVSGFIGGSYAVDQNKNTGDTNVYLKEEACFADEVYISVQSLNVTTTENASETDEDGDALSQYTLNLGLVIEQRHTDWWLNKVKIKPSHFKLKSVNLKARSKMSVFFECLAKETISVMLGGAVEGSINILEETINYAADYTLSSIENAENNKADFKPIKCSDNSFEPFYPHKVDGQTYVELSFPIKKEYLESENLIVLAIDGIFRWEKRIFLITRPESIEEKTVIQS